MSDDLLVTRLDVMAASLDCTYEDGAAVAAALREAAERIQLLLARLAEQEQPE